MGTSAANFNACPNCRAWVPDNARFCHHCGQSIGPAPVPQHQPPVAAYPPACSACGGDGSRLDAKLLVCPQCKWLRPWAPGWVVDPLSFLWSADAKAMDTLRSLGPVTSFARTVSDKLGRAWFETTLNGVRIHERQMPEIYWAAVRAARILGMNRMPDLYLSGEAMWDSMALGSDQTTVIVLGTVLANLRGNDLLFVLAREMGHAKAGHALWTTLLRFFLGSAGKRTVMGQGLLSAMSPTKMIENAIDLPIMAWARQAEITADRAGLIVVGDAAVARRVLLSMAMRSFPLYERINIDAWIEQETASDNDTMQLSEWTLTSTPYVARRLKLMREWAADPYLHQWKTAIAAVEEPAAATPAPMPTAAEPPHSEILPRPPSGPAPGSPSGPPPGMVRLICPACGAPLLVQRKVLEGAENVKIRCPNKDCGNVLAIQRKAPKPPAQQTETDADD
ncbi:MAG: M48 family metalloprotease [Bryobacteraceae bacterium]